MAQNWILVSCPLQHLKRSWKVHLDVLIMKIYHLSSDWYCDELMYNGSLYDVMQTNVSVHTKKDEQNIQESLQNSANNGKWKHGRQLLRQWVACLFKFIRPFIGLYFTFKFVRTWSMVIIVKLKYPISLVITILDNCKHDRKNLGIALPSVKIVRRHVWRARQYLVGSVLHERATIMAYCINNQFCLNWFSLCW